MFKQHQSAPRIEDRGIKAVSDYPTVIQTFSKRNVTTEGTKASQCGSMMGGLNDERICGLAFVHRRETSNKSGVKPITNEKILTN